MITELCKTMRNVTYNTLDLSFEEMMPLDKAFLRTLPAQGVNLHGREEEIAMWK